MAFSLADLFGGGSSGPPDTQDPRVLYGVHLQAGAGGFPDGGQRLKDELDRMFSVRIATLPGIPSDWLTRVRELQTDNPAAFVVLDPSRMGDVQQTPAPTRAWFLATTEQLDAWMEMFRRSQQLVMGYAANPDPSWLTQLYDYVTNDENWVAIGQAFSAAGHAVVVAGKAVGDAAQAAYAEAKSDLGAINDNLNPFAIFQKFNKTVTLIVIAAIAVIGLFFLWRSGVLGATAKVIESKTAKPKTAKPKTTKATGVP